MNCIHFCYYISYSIDTYTIRNYALQDTIFIARVVSHAMHWGMLQEQLSEKGFKNIWNVSIHPTLTMETITWLAAYINIESSSVMFISEDVCLPSLLKSMIEILFNG